MGNQWYSCIPVSYTHLDVYKRQLCMWHRGEVCHDSSYIPVCPLFLYRIDNWFIPVFQHFLLFQYSLSLIRLCSTLSNMLSPAFSSSPDMLSIPGVLLFFSALIASSTVGGSCCSSFLGVSPSSCCSSLTSISLPRRFFEQVSS